MAQEPTVGELRVMLADERRSNQQLRIDLDKLKAAHVSLQEDYVRLQKDLRDALQSIQDVRANHANILQRADKVITQKDAIIKDIRVQAAQVNAIKINEQNQKANMQMKLSWEQEKYDYVKRIEELESDIRQAHKEFNWKLRSLKQKNKQCQKTVSAYHAKIKDLKSANHQIESEAHQLRQNVPLDIHNQLQHKLKKLRRKQQEFRSLLDFSPPPEEEGKAINTGDLAATTRKQSCDIFEVKKKLDHLDAQQQKQMNQLTMLVNQLSTKLQESSPSNVSSCSSTKQGAESESSSESASTKKS